MGITNQNNALYWATGIDTSGMASDANRAKGIINNLSNDVQKEGAKMESSLRGVSSALATIGGSASIALIGKEIMDTTAKFEKFRIVLDNSLGEIEGGKALDMITKFAATTPFQLDEVTGSFIKLSNQGFIPTETEMIKLGDVASTMGKSFDQLTEALLDAQTGEFERLKEFGIKATSTGDKVTFSFKSQKTTVENTSASIKDYILSLGELNGVQGANAKISESLTGQISNLEDKFASMYNTIGTQNKGILYDAVGGAASLVDNYETVGKSLIGIIAVYGSYKAAVIAMTAISKIQAEMAAIQASLNTGVVASTITLTSAQEIQTISTIQLTTAQKLQALAAQKGIAIQKALNATMLTNPYVLAAVAIVGLGVAIWALSDKTTSAEKAVKEYNDEKERAIELEKDHKTEVEKLITTATNQALADMERVGALEALKVKYPEIFKKYDIENLKLADILSLKKQIAEHDSKESAKNNKEKVSGIDLEINKAKNAYTNAKNAPGVSLSVLNDLTANIDKLQAKKRLLEQDVEQDNVNRLVVNLPKLSEEQLKKQIDLRNQLIAKIEKSGSDKTVGSIAGVGAFTKSELTTQNELLKTELEERKAITTTGAQDLKAYQSQLKQLQKERQTILTDEMSTADRKKKLVEKDAQISEAEKNIRIISGPKEKAVKSVKLSKEQYNAEKEIKEINELILDLNAQTSRLLLEQQEDSLKNRLAAIDLEKHAEIQKINEKEVSIIEAYNKSQKQSVYDYNKTHKSKKTFTALSTKPEDIQSSITKIDPEAGKLLQTATAGIISAYGEKAKEATKKWGQEINDLVARFSDERVQIQHDYQKEIDKLEKAGQTDAVAFAKAERDKKISEVSKAMIEETALYKSATDDKLQASKETTEKLIEDIKARIRAEQEAGKLSSEVAKQMLDNINKAQATVQGNKAKDNPFAQLGNAIKGNTEAKDNLNIFKMWDADGLTDPKTAKADLAGLESAAASATASMASAAGAALGGVQDILSNVVGGLDRLGLLTAEQKKDADNVIGMVGGAANIATGNPMSIIQGSIDLIVNGYELFDTRTKNADKIIKSNQKEVDALSKAYDKLSDSIDKSFSTGKARLIDEENANLKRQRELIEQQKAAENSKKKPDTAALDEYDQKLDAISKKEEANKDARIEALTGTDVMSAIDEFAQAYADAWASGESAAQKSANVVKGILKNALINYMKGQMTDEVDALMKKIASSIDNDGKIDASEQAAIDVLTGALDAKAAQYQSALDPYLEKNKDKSGVTGELKAAMTEGTGSQLVGLWNMTAMDIRSIKEYLLYGTKNDAAKSVDISGNVGNILAETVNISRNTLRTANNTDGLVTEIKALRTELTGIKKNTDTNLNTTLSRR